MSYDIDLVHKDTRETMKLPCPLFVRGGTVPAAVNPTTGRLEQAPTEEASINITYNYASYYYEATDGDDRFRVVDEDGNVSYGIRGLYGKSASESFVLLRDMIHRIQEKYQNPDGTWKMAERTRTRWFDEAGREVHDAFAPRLRGQKLRKETETYLISEGDVSNYWEATALNAMLPLLHMRAMAALFVLDDCVWDGD